MLSYDGTMLSYDSTMLSYDGTMLSYEGAVLSYEGTMLSYEGTMLPYEGTMLSYEGPLLSYWGTMLSYEYIDAELSAQELHVLTLQASRARHSFRRLASGSAPCFRSCSTTRRATRLILFARERGRQRARGNCCMF